MYKSHISHRGPQDAIFIGTTQEGRGGGGRQRRRDLAGDRPRILFPALTVVCVQTPALALLVFQASADRGADLQSEPVQQDEAQPGHTSLHFPLS